MVIVAIGMAALVLAAPYLRLNEILTITGSFAWCIVFTPTGMSLLAGSRHSFWFVLAVCIPSGLCMTVALWYLTYYQFARFGAHLHRGRMWAHKTGIFPSLAGKCNIRSDDRSYIPFCLACVGDILFGFAVALERDLNKFGVLTLACLISIIKNVLLACMMFGLTYVFPSFIHIVQVACFWFGLGYVAVIAFKRLREHHRSSRSPSLDTSGSITESASTTD